MKRIMLLSTLVLLWIFSGPVSADIYYPHVDTGDPWDTEICVINTSDDQTVTGTLNAYDDAGVFISSVDVNLPPHARSEMDVSLSFSSPGSIGYIVLDTDSTDVQGYVKFYQTGIYRVAVPAVKDINSGDIYVSHIDSSDDWWTGIALVNTTDASVTLTITFNMAEGAEAVDPVERTLAAKAHEAFTIRNLFEETAQSDIRSAVITDAAGVVGLELFGSSGGGSQLSGILLKDSTATTIYYPHVVSDDTWWTGVVAYNTADTTTNLSITPYQADGTALTPQSLALDPMEKYVGTVDALEFPEGTAWFQIDADNPITGFELFGTLDFVQLGGYTGVGISAQAGVFAKIEKEDGGWTGIAFVNAAPTAATVSLTAYDDDGAVITAETMNLSAYEKVVDVVENIFVADIGDATYIRYSSDNDVVGFQLNGSADDMLLDGLPGLEGPLNAGDVDNDEDGYAVNGGDCDDTDSDIYPGATEICGDGIDQDCDGSDLSCGEVDNDQDGYPATTDCDDNDNSVWQLLDGYADGDHDGYGSGSLQEDICSGASLPTGYADNNTDCNDSSASVWQLLDGYADGDGDGVGYGDLVEDICSGSSLPTGYDNHDTDCDDTNGSIWQELDGYNDGDGDGYGTGALVEDICSGTSLPDDYADNDDDCDDTDADINPGEPEVCDDGIDNNCNGQTDENCGGDCTVDETYHWPHDNEVDSTMILYPPMWVNFDSTCGVNENTIQWIVEPRPLGTNVTDHVALSYLGGTSYRLIWTPDAFEGLPSENTNYEITITFDDSEGNSHEIYWEFWVGIVY